MKVSVIMRYFDALNDENAMYVEFRDGGKLLIDCNDTIKAEDDLCRTILRIAKSGRPFPRSA